jgi:hypothetical protein
VRECLHKMGGERGARIAVGVRDDAVSETTMSMSCILGAAAPRAQTNVVVVLIRVAIRRLLFDAYTLSSREEEEPRAYRSTGQPAMSLSSSQGHPAQC